MTTYAKHVTAAAVLSVALFAAQSTFVAGTAEAHCGAHGNTCGGQTGVYTGSHCEDVDLFNDYSDYSGYCVAPAGGCSGAGCMNWPCADCQPGSNFGCVTGGWSDDQGPNTDCGACDPNDPNWCNDRLVEGAAWGFCSEGGHCIWSY